MAEDKVLVPFVCTREERQLWQAVALLRGYDSLSAMIRHGLKQEADKVEADGEIDDLVTAQDEFDAPLGANGFLWSRTVQFVFGRDFVTADDLVAGLGVSRATAAKYLALLAGKYPDRLKEESAPRRGGQMGRPPTGLRILEH